MAQYHRPDDLERAVALLAGGRMTVAAGCTDLFPATARPGLAGSVVDLTGIAALRGITENAGGWRIGATTTWADIVAADLPPGFDMLRQAGREVGSVQIQNTATVAGNLCNASPAADGVPPLLALGAEIELRSDTGTRRMPLERFLTGVRRTALRPGEIVTAIFIPRASGAGRSRFLKLGARKYLVISIAMVAARIEEQAGRITRAAMAVGACSAVATRLPELETALVGLPMAEAADAVAPDLLAPRLSPVSDLRGDAAYRQEAAAELVRRALGDLACGTRGGIGI
ncbi:FAD binding domain-containing protein [Pukyongiella litopenaei]|uniref:Xanthine dehydrogenase family protein subunit M n=1 Tax=Pukyongiella litopenaei TaxID=2605946 RepID=A0A2S0MNW3_9RHOB|nr:FAD binding domain-containing protein [Pukyongiella litopenaei]AVO37582.1 xanthine dehydrogenase family protein subunit M [Pukyongiella litopenaei]